MSKKILSMLVSIVLLCVAGCSKHDGKVGLNINPEPLNPESPRPTRPTRWHDGKNLTPLQKAENELFRCHAWAEHLQMVINRNQNSGNLCRVEGSKKDLEIALKDIRKAEDRVLELRSQANKTKSKP